MDDRYTQLFHTQKKTVFINIHLFVEYTAMKNGHWNVNRREKKIRNPRKNKELKYTHETSIFTDTNTECNILEPTSTEAITLIMFLWVAPSTHQLQMCA